jgi:hypothetical protein
VWTVYNPASPPVASTVKRIGYIYTTGTLPANGTAITGFQFDVITSGMPASGGSVYNLAQVFGTTYDDPANNIDPEDQVIYDESGDKNPNNFNDDSTPPAETDGSDPDGSAFDPTADTGESDPTTHATDDGTNTGSGPDGEDNEVNLNGEVTTTDGILNGPDGVPGAVGPNGVDDDFTNAVHDPSDATPEFTNTVANPADAASHIDNVTIEPISPTQAETAFNDPNNPDDQNIYGSIPTGTVVTIVYDPTPSNAGNGDTQTATYTFNGSIWVINAAHTPINIGTLDPGESVDYQVNVDFPTALAEGVSVDIPIIAFPNTGGFVTGTNAYNGESVDNITIDRVYGPFMTLLKEARILDENGAVVQNWTNSVPAAVEVEPGYVIEYRVTYTNTTEPATGGNVGLSAQDFTVYEDGDNSDDSGVAQGTNNWYTDQSGETPLTIHANGTDASDGTVNYYTEFTQDGVANDVFNGVGTLDPADDQVVEAYVNVVGTVAPGESGTMIIRRKVQ